MSSEDTTKSETSIVNPHLLTGTMVVIERLKSQLESAERSGADVRDIIGDLENAISKIKSRI